MSLSLLPMTPLYLLFILPPSLSVSAENKVSTVMGEFQFRFVFKGVLICNYSAEMKPKGNIN